ncbi:ATP-binding protein [Streptomyces sp. TR06-5]|uniref:ATP-binding protein n=1 Tax=unclassified Streptomyces TaxID=2593676 RepID=UPI0039A0F389
MAEEVSGVALVVAQEVPTSSTMAVPHGPVGVGPARRRMRTELRACGTPEGLVDDAVLVLSELLSNASRHARPLSVGTRGSFVHAAWTCTDEGEVTIAVTDGGGSTQPCTANPSVTARGGRGLAIITSLTEEWGVEQHVTAAGGAAQRAGQVGDGQVEGGEAVVGVTVWAVLAPGGGGFSGALAGLDIAESVPGALDGEGADGFGH